MKFWKNSDLFCIFKKTWPHLPLMLLGTCATLLAAKQTTGEIDRWVLYAVAAFFTVLAIHLLRREFVHLRVRKSIAFGLGHDWLREFDRENQWLQEAVIHHQHLIDARNFERSSNNLDPHLSDAIIVLFKEIRRRAELQSRKYDQMHTKNELLKVPIKYLPKAYQPALVAEPELVTA